MTFRMSSTERFSDTEQPEDESVAFFDKMADHFRKQTAELRTTKHRLVIVVVSFGVAVLTFGYFAVGLISDFSTNIYEFPDSYFNFPTDFTLDVIMMAIMLSTTFLWFHRNISEEIQGSTQTPTTTSLELPSKTGNSRAAPSRRNSLHNVSSAFSKEHSVAATVQSPETQTSEGGERQESVAANTRTEGGERQESVAANTEG
eukprot:CAMPEP_0175134776 /NCGR_PEP_ID=MMETSP0087-20121206/8360_1 /TAXON_ID=136419 /ORGANISM="Unknown Unknown, Strain D1" /LENGTH=201 /DNA_ID=CAMNT_0016417363 /DNA_START=561 /DNA_END=1163 /DNA_ORIENTATION=-